VSRVLASGYDYTAAAALDEEVRRLREESIRAIRERNQRNCDDQRRRDGLYQPEVAQQIREIEVKQLPQGRQRL
jgi:hypothetical protein